MGDRIEWYVTQSRGFRGRAGREAMQNKKGFYQASCLKGVEKSHHLRGLQGNSILRGKYRFNLNKKVEGVEESVREEIQDLGNLLMSIHVFGEGNGIPLQYSCLENPMDGGAW